MNLTIACVLKSGGIYTKEWVSRLAEQCARHAPDHRFVCLSDVEVPVERIELKENWPGWWSKIECWRPGLFKGRVLYLDLDVVVTGDLTPLAYGDGFRICKDWWQRGFNSSVMSWDAGDTEIFDRFDASVMRRLRGDQDWITECKPGAETYSSGLAVSFKAHCRHGLPAGARVVIFHGKPKQVDMPAGHWTRAFWT